MYATSGHELRKDWYGDDGTKGRHPRLAEALRPAGTDTGILAGVSNTDFLHVISLFHTRDRRRVAEAVGKQGKDLPAVINKTPLSYKTNRIIGGVAPSEYLAKLEKGNETTPPIDRARLDAYLTSHLIDPSLLRTDNFDEFMMARQKRLLTLIEQATGKSIYNGNIKEEGDDAEVDEDTVDTNPHSKR